MQQRKKKHSLILQKLKDLQPEEKEEWIQHKKLMANQQFKADKTDRALQTYFEALLAIDQKDKDQTRLRRNLLQFKYPIMLNIVSCYYRKKEYKLALNLCNQILGQSIGSKHLKTHYKKANCLIALSQYKQARQTIKEAFPLVAIQPKDVPIKSITRQDLLKLLEELNKISKDGQENTKRFVSQSDDEVQKLIKKEQKQDDILIYTENICEKTIDCCRTTGKWMLACLLGDEMSSKDD